MSTDQLQTGHVGLNVSDIARSTDFYKRVFGLQIIGESNHDERRYAFLGDGQRLVLTLWQQSAGRFDTSRPGLHHLSFQVEAIDQVREFERRLKEFGVPLIYDRIVPHGEGTASGGIFFEDPDGIRLEVYSATGAEELKAPHADAPSCGFF
jgi:catechol 2,3-dioxygenase-like lactoylglutathione lyase family enzyme